MHITLPNITKPQPRQSGGTVRLQEVWQPAACALGGRESARTTRVATRRSGRRWNIGRSFLEREKSAQRNVSTCSLFVSLDPRNSTFARIRQHPVPRSASPMPAEYDVFLSHNSRDKPVVEQVGAWLKSRGIRVWLDKWE